MVQAGQQNMYGPPRDHSRLPRAKIALGPLEFHLKSLNEIAKTSPDSRSRVPNFMCTLLRNHLEPLWNIVYPHRNNEQACTYTYLYRKQSGANPAFWVESKPFFCWGGGKIRNFSPISFPLFSPSYWQSEGDIYRHNMSIPPSPWLRLSGNNTHSSPRYTINQSVTLICRAGLQTW